MLWSAGWLWVPRTPRCFGLHERWWCRKTLNALGMGQVSLSIPGLREAGRRAPKILPWTAEGAEADAPTAPACPAQPLPVGRGRARERSWGSTGTPQDREMVSERSAEGWGQSTHGAGIPAFSQCDYTEKGLGFGETELNV